MNRRSGTYPGIVGMSLAAMLLLAILVEGVSAPGEPSGDFVAYWTAGRLNGLGANPYSPEDALALQKAIGWLEPAPRLIWYPPWVLPILTAFGLADYRVARAAWFGLSLLLTIFCADWLWNRAGGPRNRRWIAWMIGIVFLPSFANLAAGQISIFTLLGVIGFLACARRERWFWAGVSLVLATAKPQFLYLFWLLIGLWVLRTRRWALLGGMVTGAAGLMAVACAINPGSIAQWLHAATTAPPDYWITPTLGSILRLALGWDLRWLALIPVIAGAAWGIYHWRSHRDSWRWETETPWLLLACALTTIFAWTFDLVVLLLALIPALLWLGDPRANRTHGLLLGCFVAINLLAFLTAPLLAPMRQDPIHPLALADPNRSWGYAIAVALSLWYYATYRATKSVGVTPADPQKAATPSDGV